MIAHHVSDIRTAVIGCGHLGRIHARLLQNLPGVTLTGVADCAPASASNLANELGCVHWSDYRQAIGHVDAAIVAVPSVLHADIGVELLRNGIHVLMEKPLGINSIEALRLQHAAVQNGVALAVGHVERFNPAYQLGTRYADAPHYIEAVRFGSFTFRSLDVGAVLDLMIHDLDLILAMVPSTVVDVEAFGQQVLSEHEDFASARLRFANGAVAEIKSSRISRTAQRRMYICDKQQQLHIDFGRREVELISPSDKIRSEPAYAQQAAAGGIPNGTQGLFESLLPVRQLEVPECNPLLEEQADFIQAVRTGAPPRVSADDALRSIHVAEQILTAIGQRHPHGMSNRRAA